MSDQTIQIAGYEIVGVLGEGRGSFVWLARKEADGRPAAIKRLQTGGPDEASFRRRALEEARAASRLDHPGIVRLIESGECADGLYYILEFVAGCTLAELLERKGRLHPKHALQIAEGVAQALSYAWDRERLIHHDLNPGNIMLEQDGTVRVADLGVLTSPRGTRRSFAAPEQVEESPSVDYRANIYSLGAVLYNLTTGRKPFRDGGEIEIIARQLPDYLPDPQELNAELTSEAAWMIEKMMVKDPVSRYRTWAEFLSDLMEVRKGGWPLSEPPAIGQSVVLRSALRAAPPAPAPFPEKAVKKTQKGLARKSRRILLRGPAVTPAEAALPAGGPELMPTLYRCAALGAVVALAYGAVFYHAYARLRAPETGGPRGDPVRLPKPEIPPASRRISFDEQKTAPPPAPFDASPKETTITWRHPAFLNGARLFNDALAKYTRYIQDRSHPAVLAVIERQCREAITAFESCRDAAPPEVQIADLITQCYRLISDCRQMTLMPSSPESGPAAEP